MTLPQLFRGAVKALSQQLLESERGAAEPFTEHIAEHVDEYDHVAAHEHVDEQLHKSIYMTAY